MAKKKNNKHQINMRQLFMNMQETMKSKLRTLRKNIKHEPTKGEGSESVWIKFFEKYLPKRYSVAKATIIDSNGKTSDAIDVVIYDSQYTPFIFNDDGVKYIPAESVYAVFEAKQEINKGLLEYGGKKIESVRALFKTSANVVDKGVSKPPLQLFTVLGGFLCLENGWKKSISDTAPFRSCIEKLNNVQLVNIGCVLNDKSFVTESNDKGITIKYSTSDEALIYFFLKLVLELQKLGTVRPIDLNKYIDQLDSQ